MRKFLIIQTAFLGDVILATPLIEKLHNFFPEAEVDFLVRKGNEGLLKDHPKLNEVLIWNKATNKYAHLFKLLNTIRARKYDAVINLQRFAASGFLTAFSRASNRIGFKKNPFAFAFTEKVEHRINGLHETSRNLQLIRSLTDKAYIAPKLYPNEEDYQAVQDFQHGRYVCMAPTSVWFTKQYPAEKWIELILTLPDDVKVYLVGGPDDFEACEEIAKLSERAEVMNLCGKLSLLQTCALMEKAAMNYVNDSAPQHMASAMNAKTTAIFCSTVPIFGFGPLSFDARIVQTEEELHCRPCGLHGKRKCPEGHFRCAYGIEVSQFPNLS